MEAEGLYFYQACAIFERTVFKCPTSAIPRTDAGAIIRIY